MKKPLDLVITGLPRSGTSFLCSRINGYGNTAVINEPSEIFREAKNGEAEGVGRVFDSYRRDISAGKPVLNKIRDGRFIEDTRLEDSRSEHLHEVTDENFTLGIKNTLVFLAMLPELVKSKRFPRIIASIRHPMDCIASWHNVEFPHLKSAKPAFLVDYSSAPFQQKLTALLEEENLYRRSARLWLLLAQTLLAARGKIKILRYEDIVSKPQSAQDAICGYLDIPQLGVELPEASRPVKRREMLDSAQQKVIAEECNKLASQFGYKL